MAKALSRRMSSIMHGSIIYMFESIRIFKVLRQSLRRQTTAELSFSGAQLTNSIQKAPVPSM